MRREQCSTRTNSFSKQKPKKGAAARAAPYVERCCISQGIDGLRLGCVVTGALGPPLPDLRFAEGRAPPTRPLGLARSASCRSRARRRLGLGSEPVQAPVSRTPSAGVFSGSAGPCPNAASRCTENFSLKSWYSPRPNFLGFGDCWKFVVFVFSKSFLE